MKKNLLIAVGGIFILSFLSINAVAQTSKSKSNHVLADTTFLKAIEVVLEPGEKTDLHTHAANFAYALSDGKMMVHYKDGKDELVELKQGMAAVSGPERPHITENVGNTTLRFLLVELKEHPYKAPAGTK